MITEEFLLIFVYWTGFLMQRLLIATEKGEQVTTISNLLKVVYGWCYKFRLRI